MKKLLLIVSALVALAGVAQVVDKLTTGTILERDRYEQPAQSRIKARAVKGGTMGAFVKINDESAIDSMREMGAVVSDPVGSIVTARIPLNMLDSVAALQGVSVIEAAHPVRVLMDTARAKTNVDAMQKGVSESGISCGPMTGKGVLLGDIDAGLDFTHPAFFTADRKELRLRRVWLQGDTSAAAPEGFGYGAEFTTPEAILAKGTDYSSYSHSTHVMGIAAGADTTKGNKFYGVAPETDLIFATFDDTDLGIPDALRYMFRYADSQNQPCVVNMSLGTMMGPHDGTSLRDQLIDSITGPGHLIAGAAGNNGTVTAHVSKTFAAADTMLAGLGFAESLGMPGTGELQLWGDVGGKFKVAVCTIDKTTLQPVYKSRNYDCSRSTNATVTLQKPYDKSSGYFTIVTQTSPLNGRPTAHINLAITDYKPDKVIAIMVTAEEGQTVHGWCHPTYCCFLQQTSNMIVPDTKYQSCEIGGTAKNIITAGSYTTKNLIFNIKGDSLYTGYPVNQISPFSNCGPTLDGRMKPDVAAPGSMIVSAYSSFMGAADVNFITKDSIQFNGNMHGYGAMHGTSMAAPHLAGTLACWLQAYPKLTPDMVREVLQNTSIHDQYTGNEPNNTYGYGKLDAYAGLVYLLNHYTAIEDVQTNFTEPWSATMRDDGLHILFLKNAPSAVINVYDLNGRTISTTQAGAQGIGAEQVINLDGHTSGLYFVQVNAGGLNKTVKYYKK